MQAAIASFFALPGGVKLACRAATPDANRGYLAKGAESAGYSVGLATPPDLFEAFNVGRDRRPGETVRPDLRGLYAPDLWPVDQAEFKRAVLAYFDAMVPLANRLLELFAAALGLDEKWFQSRVDAAPDTLRAIQYESQSRGPAPAEGQLGMGPHTDYGVLTILLADPIPGLQVLGPDGEWHDLIAEDGAFIINVGDLIAQWTNDRWISALHRVLPPPRRPDGPTIRRAIPFFKEANPDTVIACLPSCCTDERPARYQPVMAGDHLMAKLLGPRLSQNAQTNSTLGARAMSIGVPAP
jgi:isopenicillin N synthase-like dioxygenase